MRIIITFFVTMLSFSSAFSDNKKIVFGTEAMYPPFESKEKGVLVGFEIDLAKAIAKELGKEAEFVDMSFSSIFPSINFGKIDVGISGIVESELRGKNFDFSTPYYFERKTIVYLKSTPYETKESLKNKRVCVQLATSMQMWAEGELTSSKITALDGSNLCIEALKAKQADATIIDLGQAFYFAKANNQLAYNVIDSAKPTGVVMVYKKGSPLKQSINDVLKKLEADGTIAELKSKWLGIKSAK